jgi:hypothetical protein
VSCLSPTQICVGLAGQAGLALGHRLDHELAFLDEFVQTSANDRVTLGVQDDSWTASERRRW